MSELIVTETPDETPPPATPAVADAAALAGAAGEVAQAAAQVAGAAAIDDSEWRNQIEQRLSSVEMRQSEASSDAAAAAVAAEVATEAAQQAQDAAEDAILADVLTDAPPPADGEDGTISAPPEREETPPPDKPKRSGRGLYRYRS